MAAVFTRVLFLTMFLVGCSGEITTEEDKDFRGDKVNTAQYPNVSNSIFGGWQGPNISDNPHVALIPQVYINTRGDVAFSMACMSPNKTVMFASVIMPAALNAGHRMYVLNPIEKVVSDKGDNCTARVDVGTISFTQQGAYLHMHHYTKGDSTYSRMQY